MLIKIIFAAGFVLLAIAAVLFYLNLGGAGNFIVVGIDAFRGINFLGSARDAWSILLTGGAILAINACLAAVFWRRDRFLAHLAAFAALFAELLILMAIGVIITVN